MATLIRGIGQLVTMKGAWEKAGRRILQSDLGVIEKAAMVFDKDQIKWVGSEKKLKSVLKNDELKKHKINREIDIQGKTVLPGWVDCHTHTIFAGQRWDEFEMRCQGASYQEIAAKGGGILSTMRATRTCKQNELLNLAQQRINAFVRQGVTTVEVKSGYSLDLKNEIKMLEVARALKGPHIVVTFLGAHAKPPEFETSEDYLTFLVKKVLPQIAKKKLADRVDIFIEKGFFECASSKEYLVEAQNLGFKITIHADQLSLSGGTEVAIELAAQSADHVIQIGEEQIRQLANSETTAVLLPMADLYMKCAYPPARKLIDEGARVALATDFNPGSCPSQDIQLVGLLARLQMQMSLPEIISAWTVGGAFALGKQNIGSLQAGFLADFQVIDHDWKGLFYRAGANPVSMVFIGGKLQRI